MTSCEVVIVDRVPLGARAEVSWSPPWGMRVSSARVRSSDPLRVVRLLGVRRDRDQAGMTPAGLELAAGDRLVAVVQAEGILGAGDLLISLSYAYEPAT